MGATVGDLARVISESRDPNAPGVRRPGRPVGDDLEDHRLLVRGAVDRRGAEQPDVVRLTEEAHQVVDEPARRRTARLPVVERDDGARAGSPSYVRSDMLAT